MGAIIEFKHKYVITLPFEYDMYEVWEHIPFESSQSVEEILGDMGLWFTSEVQVHRPSWASSCCRYGSYNIPNTDIIVDAVQVASDPHFDYETKKWSNQGALFRSPPIRTLEEWFNDYCRTN